LEDTSHSPLSLLWPDPSQKNGHWLSEQSQRDLGLEGLAQAFSTHTEYRQQILDTLAFLPIETETIRYRQEVLADLKDHPLLHSALGELMPKMETLAYFNTSLGVPVQEPAIYAVTARAGELELLVECTDRLDEILQETLPALHSAGLKRLAQVVQATQTDVRFQQLKAELPHWLEALRSAASVTIGVNLDAQLRPMSATLLSVNGHTFTSSDLLDRLLGVRKNGAAGITPLYTIQESREGRGPFSFGPEPLLAKLFEDLSDILEKTARPVAQAMRRYINLNSRFLTALHPELIFYLGALNLSKTFTEAGLPECMPEIAPLQERLCEIEDGSNPNLALHLIALERVDELVHNDIHMNENERIYILTGPNQGGKTMYLQTVGLLQVMAQAGLFLPARRGRISPVDGIFTHYPLEEQLQNSSGRLGDEARRLSELFDQASRHSLVLLNESLASTSPGESLYLAQDVVAALRRLGVRAVYTTHLHELAEAAEKINAETPGDSRVSSLVASPSHGEERASRTYRVIASPPMGRSYAREIAERYGISYAQLVERMGKRDQGSGNE
jgi:DNA mismatch repair protein MutS